MAIACASRPSKQRERKPSTMSRSELGTSPFWAPGELVEAPFLLVEVGFAIESTLYLAWNFSENKTLLGISVYKDPKVCPPELENRPLGKKPGLLPWSRSASKTDKKIRKNGFSTTEKTIFGVSV
jgi:hypothetical protein